MNLWLRMLWMLIRWPFSGSLDILSVSRVAMRVWPTDLDLNLHMNNGRFLTLMDLGRFDLMMRNRMVGAMLRNRWQPVVGEATIRFLKPLGPGQRFTLETRIVGWEGKWFWLEQRFMVGDEVAAMGRVKAVLLKNRRSVPSEQVLASIGYTDPSPAFER